MRQELAVPCGIVSRMQADSKRLADSISSLEHNDMAIRNYLTRIKRLSLQSLDLLTEAQRQLSFLSNEYNNYDLKKRMRERRESTRVRQFA